MWPSCSAAASLELDVETTADRLDERHDVAEHQPSLELDAVRHVREAQREAACARHATRAANDVSRHLRLRGRCRRRRGEGPSVRYGLLEARRELGHTLVRAQPQRSKEGVIEQAKHALVACAVWHTRSAWSLVLGRCLVRMRRGRHVSLFEGPQELL